VLPFCQAYAERVGGAVVQLGTKQGNQSLFPKAELPESVTERLRALFPGGTHEVVPARFSPHSLPLVLVPDRDALLKQVLERDVPPDVAIAEALDLRDHPGVVGPGPEGLGWPLPSRLARAKYPRRART